MILPTPEELLDLILPPNPTVEQVRQGSATIREFQSVMLQALMQEFQGHGVWTREEIVARLHELALEAYPYARGLYPANRFVGEFANRLRDR